MKGEGDGYNHGQRREGGARLTNAIAATATLRHGWLARQMRREPASSNNSPVVRRERRRGRREGGREIEAHAWRRSGWKEFDDPEREAAAKEGERGPMTTTPTEERRGCERKRGQQQQQSGIVTRTKNNDKKQIGKRRREKSRRGEKNTARVSPPRGKRLKHAYWR